MSLDKINEKILKDANEYVENLKKEAHVEADKIGDEWNKKTSQAVERINKQTFVEAEEIRKRKLSVANLEIRKMNLAVKQDAVSLAITKAIDEIANMDREKYLNFLIETVKETQFCEGEIVLNDKDKKELGAKLIDLLNKDSESENFVLSEKTHKDSGGFIISMGNTEINSTIETMVYGIKEDVTPEIVSVLF